MRLKRIMSQSPIIIRPNSSWIQITLMALTVFATWALAIISLISANDTSEKMERQIEEFRKATNIENRPLLHMEMIENNFAFKFNYHNKSGWHQTISKIDIRDLQESDTLYIKCQLIYKIKLYNYGNSPLIYTDRVHGIMNKDKWANTYNKDVDAFAAFFSKIAEEEDTLSLIDNIIFPDSIRLTSKIIENFSVAPDELNAAEKSNDLLILYNYNYIPYKDFYDNNYSLLLISCIQIGLILQANTLSFSREYISMEKYIDNFHEKLR